MVHFRVPKHHTRVLIQPICRLLFNSRCRTATCDALLFVYTPENSYIVKQGDSHKKAQQFARPPCQYYQHGAVCRMLFVPHRLVQRSFVFAFWSVPRGPYVGHTCIMTSRGVCATCSSLIFATHSDVMPPDSCFCFLGWGLDSDFRNKILNQVGHVSLDIVFNILWNRMGVSLNGGIWLSSRSGYRSLSEMYPVSFE